MKKLCSAALACILLTGCGNTAKSSKTVKEEDLPYGATISMNQNTLIASQYDARFITEPMRDAVLKYYHAIETKDMDTYLAVQLPMWHDYTINTVYNGQYTDLQLLKTAYDTCALNYGGSFEYAMISIEDAKKCTAGSEGQQIVDVLDQLAEDKNEEKPSAHIGGVWELSVTKFLSKKGSNVRGETSDIQKDEQLYLIEYNSEWYVIYT
jgi:hypothetical protein